MAMSDLLDFRNELISVQGADGQADLNYRQRVFAERVCDRLASGEAVDGLVPCTFRGKGAAGRLIEIDAAALQSHDGSATLLLSIFSGEPGEPGTITSAELLKRAQRLKNFAQDAIAGTLEGKLPKNSPEEDVRAELADIHKSITKFRLVLVTDLKLSERVRELPEEQISLIPAEYHVWDIARLAELEQHGHEAIEIDLKTDVGETLPCLPAHLHAAEYRSYLCVVPARLLADLYEKFGSRLLETNVRGFLSDRGKVNRGMRATIQNHPQMFFAYNNGLTATASHVDLDATESRILRIRDLQIVNGGQTTASLFWARKKYRANLESVSVQMKLSVIPESMADRFDEIVSRIAEYANSQNKVSDADLFSNHAFHREMEKISRRTGVAPEGGGRFQTYWFYERARAQYDNERRALSASEKRAFDQKFPKKQLFSKTDLARYWACWNQEPNLVSQGAQKNFKKFAAAITNRWDRNPNEFNEVFYKRIVGVALLYKSLESQIQKKEWYEGYRINIIAYTLSLLFRTIEEQGQRLDLLRIWSMQGTGAAAGAELAEVARRVYEQLRDSRVREERPQWGNLGQWFKESLCWDAATEIRLDVPHSLHPFLISRETHDRQDSAGEKVQRVDASIDAQIEAQRLLMERYWNRLLDWNQADPVLTPVELEAVARVSRLPSNRVPDEKLSRLVLNAKRHAESEGFS